MPQKSLYSGLVKAIIFLIPNIITLGQADSNASEFPKAVDLGNGLYDFGGVLINRRDTSLSFDVICNQTSGFVEYAMVHENGKLHESLFRTSISPRWIHACLLLLKAKPLASMFTSEKNAKDLQSSNLSNHKILAVYSQPPSKANRGQKIKPSDVESFSKKNSLNVRTPLKLDSEEEYNFIKNLNPDIVVVIAYGKIIPKRFIIFI